MDLSLSHLFSAMMQPSLPVILISVAVAVLLPILLHLTLYRKRDSGGLPTFLVVGTLGAGKTAFAMRCETDQPIGTRTSQVPLSVNTALPVAYRSASTRFRSSADPTLQTQPKLILLDMPGHGKLRHYAEDALQHPSSHLKGLVFVVDAADLPANSNSIRETAEFLHDILLTLQKRHGSLVAKGGRPFPVMIAANKMDLFTALPPAMVQKALELEISEVRNSREKGLMDSGTGGEDVEREWLGEGGESVFAFAQMLDGGVEVAVVGGAAKGNDKEGFEAWWTWIADQL